MGPNDNKVVIFLSSGDPRQTIKVVLFYKTSPSERLSVIVCNCAGDSSFSI